MAGLFTKGKCILSQSPHWGWCCPPKDARSHADTHNAIIGGDDISAKRCGCNTDNASSEVVWQPAPRAPLTLKLAMFSTKANTGTFQAHGDQRQQCPPQLQQLPASLTATRMRPR